MTPDDIRRMTPYLKTRAAMFRAIREIFEQEGFLEVETPVLLRESAPEEYIESIASQDMRLLRTSPELAMKIMLTGGLERIYQIGSCFRAGEHGWKHREEFTMLEFYAAQWDYTALLKFTHKLVAGTAEKVFGSTHISFRGESFDLGAEPEIITVDDAYRRYAGCSADEADARDEFDELMVTRVEPRLGRGRLTFLSDYPRNRAALARIKKTNPAVAERWELYLGGIELANAFGELTDAAEQRRRFASALAFRAEQGMLPYPEPVDFYGALDRGLPESSGCALGLDRLVLLFTGAGCIDDVRY